MAKRIREVVQGGAVVVKGGGRASRVLVVRSSDEASWLFPKGHVEAGETCREAAAREAREEAGVVGSPGPFLGCNRYERGKRLVNVSYYRLEYVRDAPADEDRDARWCTPAQARRLLSFPELASLMSRALALQAVRGPVARPLAAATRPRRLTRGRLSAQPVSPARR